MRTPGVDPKRGTLQAFAVSYNMIRVNERAPKMVYAGSRRLVSLPCSSAVSVTHPLTARCRSARFDQGDMTIVSTATRERHDKKDGDNGFRGVGGKSQARARAAASFGVPAPISSRIRMPRWVVMRDYSDGATAPALDDDLRLAQGVEDFRHADAHRNFR